MSPLFCNARVDAKQTINFSWPYTLIPGIHNLLLYFSRETSTSYNFTTVIGKTILEAKYPRLHVHTHMYDLIRFLCHMHSIFIYIYIYITYTYILAHKALFVKSTLSMLRSFQLILSMPEPKNIQALNKKHLNKVGDSRFTFFIKKDLSFKDQHAYFKVSGYTEE